MSQGCHALLIGNSTFPAEAKLPSLHYPENDVDALNELRTSEDHGIFSAPCVLKNRPSQDVRECANEVLNLAQRDELVLIYYAGHGKLNRRGRLHLATVDTRLSTLEATSFPVSSLREFIEISRSKRIVVILDCCYSGAACDVFTRGTPEDSLQQFASGRGVHLLTASTGTQVAEEREQDRHGIFTKHLVEGIRSGGADQDGDGWVGVEELYRYVHRHVLEDGAQEPTMINLEKAGELIIARSGRKPREELCRRIEAELFRLVQEGTVTRRLFRQALRVLDLPPAQLSPPQKEQLEQLERWIDERIGVGELIESWTGLAAGQTDSTDGLVVQSDSVPEATSSDAGTLMGLDRVPAVTPEGAEAALPPMGRAQPPPRDSLEEPRGASGEENRESVWQTLRWAPVRALAKGLDGRLGLSLLLTVVFLVNLIETTVEEWMRASSSTLLGSWGHHFAWASQRLESWLSFGQGLNFLDHDGAPLLSVYAYSTSYFFLFPAACLAVALSLARRREISPFRVYALALTADYLLSLPFFLLVPVPERWAYPDSGAILLSDRWKTFLIDALRPISGLDNCFPSFHVSMTVIAVLVAFRFCPRLRWAAAGLGTTVVLSTMVLGIHWLADLIAGAAVGTCSFGLGLYLDARYASRRCEPVGRAPAAEAA